MTTYVTTYLNDSIRDQIHYARLAVDGYPSRWGAGEGDEDGDAAASAQPGHGGDGGSTSPQGDASTSPPAAEGAEAEA